jgi:hypothetical protein
MFATILPTMRPPAKIFGRPSLSLELSKYFGRSFIPKALSQMLTLPSFDDPSDFMSPFFQNATCDPYTSRNDPCLSGNYVEYAINVTNFDDVKAGLLFAQEKNIRVVIKNTGHE